MVTFPLTQKGINDWARAFDYIHREKPWMMERVKHSSTVSQTQSKMWLVSELCKLNLKKDNIAILGGWFAHIITPLLIENLKVGKIYNYEIDRDVKDISYKFNNRYINPERFKTKQRDVMIDKVHNINFDIVINTSCEHMFKMSHFKNINNLNCVYALQSTNDDQYEDHINCVENEDELVKQSGLELIYFKGRKELENGMTRFMVIGK